MATAVSKFTWDAHGAAVKTYAGASDAENTWIMIWLASAAASLDRFARWYYLDEDGEQVDLTPTDPSADPLLLQGVYDWVKTYRATFHNIPAGVKGVKVGTVALTAAGGKQGLIATAAANAAAEQLWEAAEINPLHSGKGYSQ